VERINLSSVGNRFHARGGGGNIKRPLTNLRRVLGTTVGVRRDVLDKS